MRDFVKTVTAGKDGVSLFFFGDLQRGSQTFDLEAWEAFISEFKATKNAYAIGLGDYEDWLRPSMRARLGAPLAHDLSARQQLDAFVQKENDITMKMLSPLEGRIILLHEGHHHWEFLNGGNSDQRIAAGLKTACGGWSATTRLSIREPIRRGHGGYSYAIVSTHGSGNSQAIGGDARYIAKMAESIVGHLYVRGHSCKSLNLAPMERSLVALSGPPRRISYIPRFLQVGGFARTYTNGWATSYAERAGYFPQPLMWGIVRIRIRSLKASAEKRGLKPKANNSRKTLDVEVVNRGPLMRGYGSDWGA